MRILKAFNEYLKEGIAKKVTADYERAKNLQAESGRKNKSLKERIEKIGVKNENANDYVECCYDIIMYLLRAKMYIDGYTTGGKGAHEAEVAYMRMLGFDEKDVRLMDELRYFRNGIMYYGSAMDKEYAEKVIAFTKRLVPKLDRILK